jgi:hypothetical protein
MDLLGNALHMFCWRVVPSAMYHLCHVPSTTDAMHLWCIAAQLAVRYLICQSSRTCRLQLPGEHQHLRDSAAAVGRHVSAEAPVGCSYVTCLQCSLCCCFLLDSWSGQKPLHTISYQLRYITAPRGVALLCIGYGRNLHCSNALLA